MAAQTQPRRIGGQQGAIYLYNTTNKVMDAYLWEYEEQQTVLDATTKGEHFKRYMPDVGEGRVRVQSFVSFPGAQTPLTSQMNTNLVSAGGPTGSGSFVPPGTGFPVDFFLHMIDGKTIIVGQGYIIRSQLHVMRDGIITDEIEIQVDGQPTTVN